MYSIVKLASICVIIGLVLFDNLAVYCESGGERSSPIESLSAEANEGVAIRVLWTVSAYHVGKKAVWGEAEARDMLFKSLNITPSSITFNGQTCHDVAFTSEIVNAAQYLAQRFQTTPKKLRLEEKTVRVIKSNCPLSGFREYLRLPDRRLIVSIQGILFVFEPTVNY